MIRNPSFIEIYNNALTKKQCEVLISEFERSPHIEGRSHYREESNVDYSIKKSIELEDIRFSDQSVISTIISKSLHTCMDKHKSKTIVKRKHKPKTI